MLKRIITFLLAVSIFAVAVLGISSFAAYTSQPSSFWDYLCYTNLMSSTLGGLIPSGSVRGLIWSTSNVCAGAPDFVHYTNDPIPVATGSDSNGSYSLLTCAACGEQFRCYSSDLQDAYDDYVEDLDYTSVCNDGSYYLPVYHERSSFSYYQGSWKYSYCSHSSKSSSFNASFSCSNNSSSGSFYHSFSAYNNSFGSSWYFYWAGYGNYYYHFDNPSGVVFNSDGSSGSSFWPRPYNGVN